MTDNEKVVFYKTAVYAAHYYMYRELYNNACSNLKHIAYWFVMRELSYSGMFRFSKNGIFNVPYSGISYNKKRMRSKLMLMMEIIEKTFFKNTVLSCNDFGAIFNRIKFSKNDFIFLDPPYDTEFSQYNKEEDFDRKSQERLAEILKNNIGQFMMVIKKTDFIYDLYKNYTIITFDKKYRVNFKNRNNQSTEHLIIMNY
jgi:DNA adenine methylase